jgi:hypothetical protein
VVVTTDLRGFEDLIVGRPPAATAFATGHTTVRGTTAAVLELFAALAEPAQDRCTDVTPRLHCEGLPSELSDTLMDQMLVVAALLACLPAPRRRDELTALWTAYLAGDGVSRQAVGRLITSLADLAVDNSEHAKLRAALKNGTVRLAGRPDLDRTVGGNRSVAVQRAVGQLTAHLRRYGRRRARAGRRGVER